MASIILAAGLLRALVSATPDVPCTASIDFSAVDPNDYAEVAGSGLYKSLLVRLIEERLAIVDVAESADIVLRLTRDDAGFSLSVETAVGSRTLVAAVPQASDEPGRLKFIQDVIDLVREAQVDLERSAPPPRWMQRLNVGGGVFLSGASPGILLDLGWSIRNRLVDLGVSLAAHQPLGVPAALHIFEWGGLVMASLHYRVEPAPWLIGASVGAGLWQHRYRYDDRSGPADHGVRNQPLAVGQLELRYVLGETQSVGGQVGEWLTPEGVRHRTAERTLWYAPRVRLAAGLSYDVAF